MKTARLHDTGYPIEAMDVVLRGRPVATKPWEVQWLVHTFHGVPGNIVEIGTYHGETALELASAFPERTIHCVDCALETYGLSPDEVCHLAKHMANVRLHLTESHLFTYPEDVRCVFIDGAHDWNGVRMDTELAFSHISRVGGVVVWHDAVECEHDDVMRYLSRVAYDYDVRLVRGTTLAYCEF